MVILVLSFTLTMCESSNKTIDPKSLEIDDPIFSEIKQTAWIPKDLEFTIVENNTINVETSEDWHYIGYESSGRLLYLPQGNGISISCKCNKNGECDPFYAQGPLGTTAGCAGDCTDCTMKQSARKQDVSFISGGFVNLNVSPHIISASESLPNAFDAMFELAEIQIKLEEFVNKIYADSDFPVIAEQGSQIIAPEGYSFTIVNLCGRAVLLPVPNKALSGNEVAGVKASCHCTQGTCTLKKGSIGIAKAYYCEGDCSGTCTLTIKSVRNNEDVVVYESETFLY